MMIGHSCHDEEASLRVEEAARRTNGTLAQARARRGRSRRGRRQDQRRGRDDARRHPGPRRQGGARAVDQVRQVGPRRLPPHRRRDPRLPVRALGPRHRGHQVRAGAGQEFRRAPARRDAGRRGRDAAGRGARPQAHPGPEHRLLRAGRQVPALGLGAHVGHHREGRGRAAHRHRGAALSRPPGAGDRRRASTSPAPT